MDNYKQEKENLEKQIQELQLRLETVNKVLIRHTPRKGSIVFSRRWECAGYHKNDELVHIIPSYLYEDNTIPTIHSNGKVSFNCARKEPDLISENYKDTTVLTKEQVQEVFEFIKEIANR